MLTWRNPRDGALESQHWSLRQSCLFGWFRCFATFENVVRARHLSHKLTKRLEGKLIMRLCNHCWGYLLNHCTTQVNLLWPHSTSHGIRTVCPPFEILLFRSTELELRTFLECRIGCTYLFIFVPTYVPTYTPMFWISLNLCGFQLSFLLLVSLKIIPRRQSLSNFQYLVSFNWMV